MGHVYIGDIETQGLKEPLPYYIFKCPIHGNVSSYPTGHGETLMCPICLEEESRKKMNDAVKTSTTPATADD